MDAARAWGNGMTIGAETLPDYVASLVTTQLQDTSSPLFAALQSLLTSVPLAQINVNTINAPQGPNTPFQTYSREAVDWISLDAQMVVAGANGPNPPTRSNVADSDAARFALFAGVSAYGAPNTGVVLGRATERQVVAGANNNLGSFFSAGEGGTEFHFTGNGVDQLGFEFIKSHGAQSALDKTTPTYPADYIFYSFGDGGVTNVYVHANPAGNKVMQWGGDAGTGRMAGDVGVSMGPSASAGQGSQMPMVDSVGQGYGTLQVGGSGASGGAIVLRSATGRVGALTANASGIVVDTAGGPNFVLRANGAAQVVATGPATAVNQVTLEGATTGGAPVVSVSGSDAIIGLALAPKGAGATVSVTGGLPQAANDAAAAALTPPVPVQGLYQNSGVLRIRLT